MASTIGQAAYAEPKQPRIKFPRDILDGATSGISGAGQESSGRYDATPTHHFRYVPGANQFWKIYRAKYIAAKGTWGQAELRKFNPIKQIGGSSGYFNQKPSVVNSAKFKSMVNYGTSSRIDKFLPRGGNVLRVIGTDNTEEPISFIDELGPNFRNQYGGTDMSRRNVGITNLPIEANLRNSDQVLSSKLSPEPMGTRSKNMGITNPMHSTASMDIDSIVNEEKSSKRERSDDEEKYPSKKKKFENKKRKLESEDKVKVKKRNTNKTSSKRKRGKDEEILDQTKKKKLDHFKEVLDGVYLNYSPKFDTDKLVKRNEIKNAVKGEIPLLQKITKIKKPSILAKLNEPHNGMKNETLKYITVKGEKIKPKLRKSLPLRDVKKNYNESRTRRSGKSKRDEEFVMRKRKK